MAIHEICYGFNDMTCGDYIYAIYSSNTENVKALLDRGQDPYECDSDRNSPYFWASFRGDAEMIRAIANAQKRVRGIEGLAPFHVKMAVSGLRPVYPELQFEVDKQFQRFVTLFDLVPDKNQLKNMLPEILSEAVLHNADPHYVQFLVDHGACPTHQMPASGNTPIHQAAKDGRPDLLGPLLQKDSNVNALNNEGKSPLRVAAEAVLISGLMPAHDCFRLLKEHRAMAVPSLTWRERLSLWQITRRRPSIQSAESQ